MPRITREFTVPVVLETDAASFFSAEGERRTGACFYDEECNAGGYCDCTAGLQVAQYARDEAKPGLCIYDARAYNRRLYARQQWLEDCGVEVRCERYRYELSRLRQRDEAAKKKVEQKKRATTKQSVHN